MLLAHLGVATFIFGVTVSRGYESDVDVKMSAGDTAPLAGYSFRLAAFEEVSGPNYVALRASVDVSRDGQGVTRLYPEKRHYTVQNMPMTEAGFDAGFFRHLYVSLGDPVGEGAWTMRIQHKPLIGWIWFGCLLMALGGLLAALDRRYRAVARRQSEAGAAAAAR
jgi:cytochrome c-type biogenesis protein CcmF